MATRSIPPCSVVGVLRRTAAGMVVGLEGHSGQRGGVRGGREGGCAGEDVPGAGRGGIVREAASVRGGGGVGRKRALGRHDRGRAKGEGC